MNGIINILKPPMTTSNSVVSAIKKYSGQRHVGHTGTLDPNAAGVLPICIGKSTKLAEFFLAEEKEYIGEILFGIETDTCDTEGNILFKSDNIPSIEQIVEALEHFRGEIVQYPPQYSAIKINGQKAYELARNNIQVDIPPRNVIVHSLEILNFTEVDRAVIKVKCSKGTYIRSLVRDIGRYLGTYACLSLLVRTKSGVFDIENAVTLDEAKNAFLSGNYGNVLIEPNDVLAYMPYVDYSAKYEKSLLCGNALDIEFADKRCGDIESDTVLRVLCKGNLICIAKAINNNGKIIIQPTKVIAD